MKKRLREKKGVSKALVFSLIAFVLIFVLGFIIWVVVDNPEEEDVEYEEFTSDTINLNKEYTYYDESLGELIFSIAVEDVNLDKILVLISSNSGVKSYTITNTEQIVSGLRIYPSGTAVKLPNKNSALTYVASGFSEKPYKITISPVIDGKQYKSIDLSFQSEDDVVYSFENCSITCNTESGCRNNLVNGQITTGECCGSGDCYTCNTGYTWNGTACVGESMIWNNSLSIIAEYKGGGFAKTAKIYLDGKLISTNGDWKGNLSPGAHTIGFENIDDGKWYTLHVPQQSSWFNQIFYCENKDVTKSAKKDNCSNWKQVKEEDFVSKKDQTGTQWMTESLRVYPDAIAPENITFTIGENENKIVKGLFDEKDSYYVMHSNGVETKGHISMTDGATGSGTTSWNGKYFTYRYSSGDGSSWHFTRVKTTPTKFLIKRITPKETYILQSEFSQYYLLNPHTASGGGLIKLNQYAVYWAANSPAGYSNLQVLEEVKERCSEEIIYEESYSACSPNGYFKGKNQTITIWWAQPQYQVCHYEYDGNPLTGCRGPLVMGDWQCEQYTYTDFQFEKDCGFGEENSCSMIEGVATCK